MGLPAVIGGYLVVHSGGLLPTTREYGLAVMVLAAVALLGVALPRRQQHPGTTVTAPELVAACGA